MVTRRLRWVTRDAGIIMGARAIHTFIQGVMAVTLGVYLVELGFSLAAVGLFFSLGFASTGLLSLVSTFASERIGRRGLLLVYTGFTIAGGVALLVTGNPAALLAFGFIGSFTGAPGNVGPTQSLEQAALAGVVDPAHRTDLFALYRITATTASALGALAAGIPVLLQSMGGIEELASFRMVFAVLVVLRLAVGALFMFLSDQVEAGQAYRGAWVNPMKLPSRRTIFALTGLFSLDHLSGSIVVQGLLAVWFKQQFGLNLGELAVLFFSTQVFAVGSLWVAAKIANRIGLINTMTWAHLPSGLFLIAVAFAPWAWLAVTFLLLRSLFAQTDVPARDSYIMAVVEPHERVAMASIHVVGRSAAGTVGPTLSTAVLQAISFSAPLIGSGLVKTAYIVSLYLLFKDVHPPEERARAEARATRKANAQG